MSSYHCCITMHPKNSQGKNLLYYAHGSVGQEFGQDTVGTAYLCLQGLPGASAKKIWGENDSLAGDLYHLKESSPKCQTADIGGLQYLDGSLCQNTYGQPLHVVWASSQLGGWVPKMSVPIGQKQICQFLKTETQQLAQYHFHHILLVRRSQSPNSVGGDTDFTSQRTLGHFINHQWDHLVQPLSVLAGQSKLRDVKCFVQDHITSK